MCFTSLGTLGHQSKLEIVMKYGDKGREKKYFRGCATDWSSNRGRKILPPSSLSTYISVPFLGLILFTVFICYLLRLSSKKNFSPSRTIFPLKNRFFFLRIFFSICFNEFHCTKLCYTNTSNHSLQLTSFFPLIT